MDFSAGCLLDFVLTPIRRGRHCTPVTHRALIGAPKHSACLAIKKLPPRREPGIDKRIIWRPQIPPKNLGKVVFSNYRPKHSLSYFHFFPCEKGFQAIIKYSDTIEHFQEYWYSSMSFWTILLLLSSWRQMNGEGRCRWPSYGESRRRQVQTPNDHIKLWYHVIRASDQTISIILRLWDDVSLASWTHPGTNADAGDNGIIVKLGLSLYSISWSAVHVFQIPLRGPIT